MKNRPNAWIGENRVPLELKAAFPGATGERRVPKIGRNEPCPCGSGKKFKKCCVDWRGYARKLRAEKVKESAGRLPSENVQDVNPQGAAGLPGGES